MGCVGVNAVVVDGSMDMCDDVVDVASTVNVVVGVVIGCVDVVFKCCGYDVICVLYSMRFGIAIWCACR